MDVSKPAMITVRIARAVPRPGAVEGGMFRVDRVLVVLADDAAGRALPLWLPSMEAYPVQVLLDRPAGVTETAPVSEELTARLLAAAGVTVTTVDVDELGPEAIETPEARIELDTPGGPRQVTGRLAGGLALAAATGAPVRVAGPVMERLAAPVRGGDLLGPFLQREPATAGPDLPRRAPGNLAFGDGLAGWSLHGRFLRDVTGAHWQDYSAAAAGQSAILRSAVPHPRGPARLAQVILAADYRGRTVAFRADMRAQDVSDQARLYLRVQTDEPERARFDHHGNPVTGTCDWGGHQVTAPVPPGAILVEFGVALDGHGQVELRHADFTSP